jgi:hypothetical protein
MQEYSFFAIVEEPEVGGQRFILKCAATGGVLLSIGSGGHWHCEDDHMRAGPLRSQWRGSKILEENQILWFNRNCYRAL